MANVAVVHARDELSVSIKTEALSSPIECLSVSSWAKAKKIKSELETHYTRLLVVVSWSRLVSEASGSLGFVDCRTLGRGRRHWADQGRRQRRRHEYLSRKQNTKKKNNIEEREKERKVHPTRLLTTLASEFRPSHTQPFMYILPRILSSLDPYQCPSSSASSRALLIHTSGVPVSQRTRARGKGRGRDRRAQRGSP